MAARKAFKASAKNDEENNSNSAKKRSGKFSQLETDLLCSLVIASDLNTNVTNKMTKYGRLTGWNDIATMFNVSPGVTVS